MLRRGNCGGAGEACLTLLAGLLNFLHVTVLFLSGALITVLHAFYLPVVCLPLQAPPEAKGCRQGFWLLSHCLGPRPVTGHKDWLSSGTGEGRLHG